MVESRLMVNLSFIGIVGILKIVLESQLIVSEIISALYVMSGTILLGFLLGYLDLTNQSKGEQND